MLCTIVDMYILQGVMGLTISKAHQLHLHKLLLNNATAAATATTTGTDTATSTTRQPRQ
jgi:hypothetical protein